MVLTIRALHRGLVDDRRHGSLPKLPGNRAFLISNVLQVISMGFMAANYLCNPTPDPTWMDII